mmetsp:Transcript_51067/g.146604  ORF Transcript_51067/g.146604 Transcript_51067/m.146604 type:complete len:382 (-) Transcript_51067:615-1760(-)
MHVVLAREVVDGREDVAWLLQLAHLPLLLQGSLHLPDLLLRARRELGLGLGASLAPEAGLALQAAVLALQPALLLLQGALHLPDLLLRARRELGLGLGASLAPEAGLALQAAVLALQPALLLGVPRPVGLPGVPPPLGLVLGVPRLLGLVLAVPQPILEHCHLAPQLPCLLLQALVPVDFLARACQLAFQPQDALLGLLLRGLAEMQELLQLHVPLIQLHRTLLLDLLATLVLGLEPVLLLLRNPLGVDELVLLLRELRESLGQLPLDLLGLAFLGLQLLLDLLAVQGLGMALRLLFGHGLRERDGHRSDLRQDVVQQLAVLGQLILLTPALLGARRRRHDLRPRRQLRCLHGCEGRHRNGGRHLNAARQCRSRGSGHRGC